MLFRWFVELAMDVAAWDHSTFSKNRDLLMVHDLMVSLLGTLIQGSAGHKRFAPKTMSEDDSPPDGGAGF
ncbi:hypothetical protein BTHE68_40450 [Burkholderia sp. THE68]|nr:hypothetical protein BTHE68_40450 [Burkholderia sp. THE68]